MRPLRFPHLHLCRRAQSTWRTRPPVNGRTNSAFILGASSAVAGYVGWRMTSGKTIALDAVPQMPSHSSVPLTAHLGAKEDTPASQLQSSSSAQSTFSPATPEMDTNSPESPPLDLNAEPEESGNEAAFNPQTGEINWDCPCLGGMAHGPCGMPFREAFSCFVFSEKEPKGIDCVEKFRMMQECFREHPDVYGDELMDDEDEDAHSAESSPALDTPSEPPSPHSVPFSASESPADMPVSNASVANKPGQSSRPKPPEKD